MLQSSVPRACYDTDIVFQNYCGIAKFLCFEQFLQSTAQAATFPSSNLEYPAIRHSGWAVMVSQLVICYPGLLLSSLVVAISLKWTDN
jgi:hypothetical protein